MKKTMMLLLSMMVFFVMFSETSYAAQTISMDDRGKYYKSGPYYDSSRDSISYSFNTQDLKSARIEYYHTSDMTTRKGLLTNSVTPGNYYGSTSMYCEGYYRNTFYKSDGSIGIVFTTKVNKGDVGNTGCTYPLPPEPKPEPKPEPEPEPQPDPKPNPEPEPDPDDGYVPPDYNPDDLGDPNCDPVTGKCYGNETPPPDDDDDGTIYFPDPGTGDGGEYPSFPNPDYPGEEDDEYPGYDGLPPIEEQYEIQVLPHGAFEEEDGMGVWCTEFGTFGPYPMFPCDAMERGYHMAEGPWCFLNAEWVPCSIAEDSYEVGESWPATIHADDASCVVYTKTEHGIMLDDAKTDYSTNRCPSEFYEPPTDKPPNGSDDPTDGADCEGCKVFDCPGWNSNLQKLDEIRDAIPPPPNWNQVSQTFSDAIVPRLVNETETMLSDLLGKAPEPPSPMPDLPPLNDHGFQNKKPDMQDSGVKGFDASDVKNGAPVIPFEDDPTGGFNLSVDPVNNLPDVVPGGDPGIYKRDPVEQPAAYPGKPKEPQIDMGGAPKPGDSGGTPPTPGDSGGIPPKPDDGVSLPTKPNEVGLPSKEQYMPKPGGG